MNREALPPLNESLHASGMAVLPVGWTSTRLDELCEAKIGAVDPQSEPEKPFIYVDISSIDNESKQITAPKTLLGKDAPSRARQIIKTGDILVATTRPNLNAVAIVPSELDGQVCSTGFCVLRPKNSLNRRFLFAYVQSKEFIKSLTDLVQGALYPAVTDAQVRGQVILLPPPNEQERIAAIVTEQMGLVARARAATKEQLKAAEALPGAYFRKAFHEITPLGLNVIDEPAPKGWKWTSLVKLAQLESGHTPSRYRPEWWGGDIPWIALPDIRALDGKVAYETSEYTNEDGIANSSARVLPAGTVALSRTASVGFVTIMGRPMATSQDFVNWVCGPDLDPHFLALLLRASRNFILSIASGAVHKTVYVPTVKSFYVCIPDIQEQRRIAENLNYHLSGAEQAQKALQQQLEYIDKLPALLLRRAFTGEL
jgi:type I restriction enzyme S subunit